MMFSRISFLLRFVFLIEISATNLGQCPGVDLPCTLHRFNGNDCSSTVLREEFPEMYETETSNFPGMPGSFDLSARYKYYEAKQRYKPQANLTFTPPPNGAKNFVKGFEIIRVPQGIQAVTCYLLDLSNVTWKDDLEELSTVFRLELFPLQYRFYSFTLYALPKQANKYDVYDQYLQKYMELPEYDANPSGGSWRASIYVTQHNKEGAVNVTIDPPPPEFGFQAFNYWLIYADNDSTVQQKNKVPHLSVVFDGLYENHTYKVWVKPYDPFYLKFDSKQCLCLDADGLACDQCTTTTTKPFTYVYTGPPRVPPPAVTSTPKPKPSPATTQGPVQPVDPTNAASTREPVPQVTTEPEGISDIKVAMAVVGTLVGLILIVGVALFMYHRKCRGIIDDETGERKKDLPKGRHAFPLENPGFTPSPAIKGPNNMHAEKLKFDKRPKLVLLYEEDHEYHRQVVQHFATFLQQHCQCAAMCVEWQLDAPWVHEDIEQADYVVIVNSEGAYQSYMEQYGQKGILHSQFKGNQVPKQMSNINSIRNKFLHDERYDNVVMVYFEYTDEQFVLPDICPGYKYKLLKHFTDFLLHIHKLHRTDNLNLYDLPFDGSFSKKPVGQLLLDSMSKVVQYQNENSNWAQKKLAYKRMYSHTSEESQFDSGLPEDWARTPSVENPSPLELNANQRDLLKYLDGYSICTVNPSDIGVSMQNDLNTLPTVSENVPSLNVTKSRPKLSPHSFEIHANQSAHYENLSSPPSSTVESDFGFFPPDDFDDNYDAVSKTISEQMKSIVDRYQAYNRSKNPKYTEQPETSLHENENEVDRNNDLYLLRVQSGEIPFISCNMDSDAVSLGGESV